MAINKILILLLYAENTAKILPFILLLFGQQINND